ncbi:MAG: hypothetical protein F9K18_04720 [Thermoanaerobaculia bacterium]|nr:MAG: hypothetical protein F9K18_04720 [Thermoanaerobaculia bacterium]
MRTQSVDTPPEVEEMLVRRLREIGPRARLQATLDLNRTLEALALLGIRSRHGEGLGERQVRLRLFALRLDRDHMVRAFGWDPEKEGS